MLAVRVSADPGHPTVSEGCVRFFKGCVRFFKSNGWGSNSAYAGLVWNPQFSVIQRDKMPYNLVRKKPALTAAFLKGARHDGRPCGPDKYYDEHGLTLIAREQIYHVL